jgi:hypothetical protein
MGFLLALKNNSQDFAVNISSFCDFSTINLAIVDDQGLEGDLTVNPFTSKPVAIHLIDGSTSKDSPVFTVIHEFDEIIFPGVESKHLDHFLGLENHFSDTEEYSIDLNSIHDPILRSLVEKLMNGHEDWYLLTPLGESVTTQDFIIPDGFSEVSQTVAFHPTPEEYAQEINSMIPDLLSILEHSCSS